MAKATIIPSVTQTVVVEPGRVILDLSEEEVRVVKMLVGASSTKRSGILRTSINNIWHALKDISNGDSKITYSGLGYRFGEEFVYPFGGVITFEDK